MKVGWGRTCGCTEPVARAQDELLGGAGGVAGRRRGADVDGRDLRQRHAGGLLHRGRQRLGARRERADPGLVAGGADAQGLAQIEARRPRLGSRRGDERERRQQNQRAHGYVPPLQPHTVVIGTPSAEPVEPSTDV